jgi:hypothetical protein
MPIDTAAGSDNPAHANEGDTSNGGAADMDARVNRIVTSHIKRLENKFAQMMSGDGLNNAIMAKLEEFATVAGESQQAPSDGSNETASGKLTMKALQDQVSNLTKQLAQQQKAAQEAQAQAQDTRRRSEFHAKLAAKMGADHPMLGTLMDSLYDVKKRVVDSDGRLAMKFVDQWGNEELKPLDEGVNALFDGELKHLVQTSKAQSLPSAGFRGMGKPIPGMQTAKGQPQINMLDRDLIEAVAKDRPELAETLAAQALAAAQNK